MENSASMDPNDREVSRNGQNNIHGSDVLPPNKQAYNRPNHGVRSLQGALVAIWNAVQHILTAYVVFVVLTGVITDFFPEVSCKLPVVSEYSPRCVRKLDHPGKPAINPDFITLSRLQSRLVYVMEDSAVSPVVADKIKSSEVALRDLVKRVELSSLVRKDTLGRDLGRFVLDAKTAGASLQEFSSHVWGAVDLVLSRNEYMLIMLESISSEASWGSFTGIVNLLIPSRQETTAARRKSMEDIWLQATKSLDQTLYKLIHEAQANVGFLQRLEIGLNNIQDKIAVEEENLRGEKREFEKQWFPDDTEWKSNSEVLEMVKNQRNSALKHVTGMLVKLKRMSNDLDDLKANVKKPLIAGPSNIPIEAYTRNIREATDRLVYGQSRAREIEVEYRQKKFCSDSST